VPGPLNPTEVYSRSAYDSAGKRLPQTRHGHQTRYTYDGLYRVVHDPHSPNAALPLGYDEWEPRPGK